MEVQIKYNELQYLLNQVDSIVKKYDQIAEITGERFNIFSILGLQDNETRLHSKLINELLNPKGNHGQKDLFLKLFIEVVSAKIDKEIVIDNSKNISSQKIKDFETYSAISEIEKHVGFINDDRSEGGRIDIIISDSKNHGIIIENKIWAADQEKQLLRYHKYGIKKFDTFHLIYLTIDESEPSKWSTNNELNKNEFICLSYNIDILNWLDLCLKECTKLPIIRETLTQYINQLKNYSGQSINHMEEIEIFELLSQGSNFKSLIKLSNTINMYKNYIYEKMTDDVLIEFKEIGLLQSEEIPKNGIYKGYSRSGLSLSKEEWKYFELRFEFENKDFKELFYGIRRKLNLSSDILNSIEYKNLFNNISEIFIKHEYKSAGWWPAYRYSNHTFDETEFWIALSENKVKEELICNIKTIYEILNENKLISQL